MNIYTNNKNKGNIFNENNLNSNIKENFFVFDSNNLESVESHMYGYSINKNGILTDNYYKILGYIEEPSPQEAFVMAKKIRMR